MEESVVCEYVGKWWTELIQYLVSLPVEDLSLSWRHCKTGQKLMDYFDS